MTNEFPKRLRQMRKRKRISQQVLGELCGVSKNSINQYESGERFPAYKTLMELADFFEVSLDYLCGRKDYF